MQKTTRFAQFNLRNHLVTGILTEDEEGTKIFMYEFAIKGAITASLILYPYEFAELSKYRDMCFSDADKEMLGTNLHEA